VCPTPVSKEEVFSPHAALEWFDMLLAVLDCYTWVFGENLLTPSELFGGSYIIYQKNKRY